MDVYPQADSGEEHDHAPDISASPNPTSETHSEQPSTDLAEPLTRPCTRARRVSVHFFDPLGVRELRHRLSRACLPATQGEHDKVARLPRNRHLSRFLRTLRAHSETTSDFTLVPNDVPFDMEKTLKTIVQRLDQADIVMRQLGVIFEDLRVVGLGASMTYQQTLGSVLNPLQLVDKFRELRHPPVRDILSGFEGCVRPGEMLLVLGCPGAGCSTLLKVLANQREEFHAVYGDVRYDAFTPKDVHAHYRGDVQYVPEDDVHFPTLTVRETLDFAAKTRTPHNRIEGSRAQHRLALIDVLLTVFGLKHVENTLVGDASVRGVSGGEKKRVSISEVLATRSLLTSWDNSTRGLDASTALEFVRALRLATDIAHMTSIVSIYQAGESLYELFDKVCVIHSGKMIYFGPANRARQYFNDLGFSPANRQTTADFLVAITDPAWRRVRPGYHFRAPRTPDDFAQCFRESEFGSLNKDDIKAYRAEVAASPERMESYRTSSAAEHARTMPQRSAFITSIPMQARALMLRRLQIVKGAISTQVIQLALFVVQAVIVGTIFLKLSDTTQTFFSRGGVLFFALLFAALTSMAEIAALFSQRPIVLRHFKAAMYHPFVEALALTLVDVPTTAVTLILFSIILYFLVRLQQSAGQFFIFLLIVFSMTITMKAWFRAIAAAFRSAAPAQAVAGISVLILTLYTGYSIPQPSMIGALRWLTYVNPLKYGFESMVVNEFHTLEGLCASLVPSGPGYQNVSLANQVCTTVGSQSGQAYVNGMRYIEESFGYYYDHLWRNFGIIIVFGVGFVTILLTLTEVNTGVAGATTVTVYKRGAKLHLVRQGSAADEEKQMSRSSDGGSTQHGIDADNVDTQQEMKKIARQLDTFSFENLTYIVPVGHERRVLLENVSGYVAPGKLTALIGESGAGKTTLLNALSERTAGGIVTGNRFMNGQPLPEDFDAQTGYCQQLDTHLPYCTVREALLFSARLRQPASVPMAEKEAYVDKCLKMCGLEDHADAVVGSLGVEQRKRTTIGVELVAKPSLIFLDEPTSGLDSQSAWAIVCFLRSLASGGQSIVCTIHQPSAELFEIFDKLLLLRKGGQTVYFGDVGHKSSTLISYFESHGARPCGPTENPAEYILDVIGAGATATSEVDWYDVWKKSQESRELTHELGDIHSEGRKRPPVAAITRGAYHTSWWYQVTLLLQRDTQAHWRNLPYMMSKFMVSIAGGLLIGFTFFKAKDSIQGTQNKLFAIFMSTITCTALANQLQVPFMEMRSIYEIRECHSRMYGWTTLITSQILAEIPWNVLSTTLFFLCWYWTVEFPTGRAGYTYLMLGVVFPLYYTTIGQAVAAMCPNPQISALLFSFLFSFVLSFNGVMQPFRELGWWQWMYHVSPFTYLIEGLLGQVIGHSSIRCSSTELVIVEPPSGQTCSEYMGGFIANSGGYLTNGNATSGCQYCAYATTDAFLESSFNIYYSRHWRDFGIFCVYVAFNTACVYLCTYFFRIRSGSIFGWFKSRIVRRK
ncbi:pleiotropic drug resistance ABC transporter [Laetiporus sulphureus 93-53]|uniref:Pleiotropic drug resistance ABC transporter n=1 Tax=Laetiporus sulphureus 93-53 TaxID=1314785 RepID=A0A165DAU6_9APHY|nr:pleiotropic drug resistance ABC transporter [Laetiporus sulphureus 93-53]KZT04452.1 pleiotropic drug resistance ABC transporter [Laetiporus sulphureus 93-53]